MSDALPGARTAGLPRSFALNSNGLSGSSRSCLQTRFLLARIIFMFQKFFAFFILLAVAFFVSAQDKRQETPPKKNISVFTEKLQKIDGFVPLFINAEDSKMYLEISRLNREFLYQVSLPTGVGSNPIGLDRGQLGSTKVVFFERAGNKILMVQPNYDYRALSDNAAERRSVEESFAKSVIWVLRLKRWKATAYWLTRRIF